MGGLECKSSKRSQRPTILRQMDDQNYQPSIENHQQVHPQIIEWQSQLYQDQEQVRHHQDQECQQHLQLFQCQQPQQDQCRLQQQQPQHYFHKLHNPSDPTQPSQEQQWHQQDLLDQHHFQKFHWQQQPQKDHPEQLREQGELDHYHGYQQHLEDDFRETYGQMTDKVLIREEYDQQLAVAFNRGQEQHSQKLTLAFIQEEEDQKLAVALFQEDQGGQHVVLDSSVDLIYFKPRKELLLLRAEKIYRMTTFFHPVPF